MRRQIGLALAAALKLTAIGLALALNRETAGTPAIVILPLVALMVGLSLGRGNRRLAALVAGAAGAVNAIGFPIVLLVILQLRFGGPAEAETLLKLAGLIAVGGVMVAPAAAWMLARKPDPSPSNATA